MQVVKRDGSFQEVDVEKIRCCVARTCGELEGVCIDAIVDEAVQQLYDGISTSDIDQALVLAARQKVVEEPNYAYAAARLAMVPMYKEIFGQSVLANDDFDLQYRETFISNLVELNQNGRISTDLINNFDLYAVSEALKPERDNLFKIAGIQALDDRYFIHIDGRRMETPQAFWMRVAMGLCINEEQPTQRAIEAYELISQLYYVPGTPTLFNSGTTHPQLSSCYLSTIDDSIDGIFGNIHNQARLSKWAGGLGNDFTPIRGQGSKIQGTNGKSQHGVISWMKIFNDMLVAVDQGGKRRGAGCAYLETWHIDIEDFLQLRKNTGDERRRTHDMHTANWIPDLFMKRVKQEGQWYLFSPSDVPDLHDKWGEEFEQAYLQYCKGADEGFIENYRVIPAKDLWRKMVMSIFETGHPWMTFKDPSNIAYTNKHAGTVHSSNLCTEILLHTKPTKYENGEPLEYGETAVCNLGSINIARFIDADNKLMADELRAAVKTAIRLLDNVIDINFYPTQESWLANKRNRPVGLGMMGWADFLHHFEISFSDPSAARLAGAIHKLISEAAIEASADLAEERGEYENFKGSDWSEGILPADNFDDIVYVRGNQMDEEYENDGLRNLVARGMRNSNVMAIAPTATISVIAGCSQSIEPDFGVCWVASNLSGDFIMYNEYFVRRMKKLGLWTQELAAQIKDADGDISGLDLPDDIKCEYRTAFDVPYQAIIDAAAARQRWIDMGQSVNLYNKTTSMKHISDMYFYAWNSGLKTTYYMRTKAASVVEKSVKAASQTQADGVLPVAEPKACSLANPDCESCQ